MEHKDDKIQWARSTPISEDAGERETLKEVMTRPNEHLWKLFVIPEVNNFLSRKAWIPANISVMKSIGIKPVSVKWVFKIKEEHDGLTCKKSINVVKGYIQVPVVKFIESFFSVVSDNSKGSWWY